MNDPPTIHLVLASPASGPRIGVYHGGVGHEVGSLRAWGVMVGADLDSRDFSVSATRRDPSRTDRSRKARSLEAPHSDSPMTMLHPMLSREMRERRSEFESPRLL
jgi:hypothetical protein